MNIPSGETTEHSGKPERSTSAADNYRLVATVHSDTAGPRPGGDCAVGRYGFVGKQ
ncbi:MAG: hypothetical protein VX223_08335 [Myxococcota bacterium]|nr:hypothetical protein [Myxococcota bacterium]